MATTKLITMDPCGVMGDSRGCLDAESLNNTSGLLCLKPEDADDVWHWMATDLANDIHEPRPSSSNQSNQSNEKVVSECDSGKPTKHPRRTGVKRSGGTGLTAQQLEALDTKTRKRVMANRLSAARSKERKNTYIKELEGQLEAMQAEMNLMTERVQVLRANAAAQATAHAGLYEQACMMSEALRQRDGETAELLTELQRMQMATGVPACIPNIAPSLAVHLPGPLDVV